MRPPPQRLVKVVDLLDMQPAPSVFCASGWVHRRLTCEEMLRCLDIPQQMDKDIVDLLGRKMDSEGWKSNFTSLGICSSFDDIQIQQRKTTRTIGFFIELPVDVVR